MGHSQTTHTPLRGHSQTTHTPLRGHSQTTHTPHRDLLNDNQYGFTPQRSTVDASMAVKKFVEESLQNGQYVVLVSLDVQGAFDAHC